MLLNNEYWIIIIRDGMLKYITLHDYLHIVVLNINSTKKKYLDMIHENKYKIVLSQFRISAHHLEIEIGRYPIPKIARMDRICQVCKMNTVESDYHFLLVCPAYKELRRKYFPGYYNHWPTITKFDTLMTSESRKLSSSSSKVQAFNVILGQTDLIHGSTSRT